MTSALFRFYAELNYFVAPCWRQRAFEHACSQDASVKHMIEVFGVPHTEVALILANGKPVDFSYRLRDQDHISVYPRFCNLASDTSHLELQQSSGPLHFVADAHMGRLARDLRMLGFDVLYRNDISDAEIVSIAAGNRRIVLTRDRALLMRKQIARGCYLYSIHSDTQLLEVVRRYRLATAIRPFSRCLDCNGALQPVSRQAIEAQLPTRSAANHEEFRRCEACGHIYWDGTHVARMRERITALLSAARIAMPAS